MAQQSLLARSAFLPQAGSGNRLPSPKGTLRVSDSSTVTAGEQPVTIDRRSGDRRHAKTNAASDPARPAAEQNDGKEAPQRRKQQRRRQIDPTTCERDYNTQEIEFMQAMDDYKRAAGRMFPTCSEVLEVVRSLGYVQLDDEQRRALLGDEAETLMLYGESAEAADDWEADEQDDF